MHAVAMSSTESLFWWRACGLCSTSAGFFFLANIVSRVDRLPSFLILTILFSFWLGRLEGVGGRG